MAAYHKYPGHKRRPGKLKWGQRTYVFTLESLDATAPRKRPSYSKSVTSKRQTITRDYRVAERAAKLALLASVGNNSDAD